MGLIFHNEGGWDEMKCEFCGKPRDEMDSSSKMCTICGWSIDAGSGSAKETVETE